MEENGKIALITGINGQDGGYLAELLLEKGYKVYGMHRRSSVDGHLDKVEHLKGKITFVCADLSDHYSIDKIIQEIKPNEIYNLAAQSQVAISFDQPFITNDINWLGVERLLDSIKNHCPNAKFYQASTSELFGKALASPQTEETPFNPISPYAVAKLKAHNAIKRARQEGLYACSGILFNHESPRRGTEFVTRKLTDGIARIKLQLPQRVTGESYLEVGNLEAERDWGYAKDYVEAIWIMIQQESPKDYVIATGEAHTVREFVEAAAEAVGIKITWKGEGLNEEGYDQDGNKIIVINPKFFRPREVEKLRGDSRKAKEELGWQPKTRFKELVKMMVESDLEKLKNNIPSSQ